MPESVGLEQRRAKKAWTDACQGFEAGHLDYVDLVSGAPALIMGSGLMQALAFYRARGDASHRILLDQLCAWLSRRPGFASKEFAEVMERLDSRRRIDYLEDTAEVLAYLRWLRHFAAAVGEKE